MTQGDLVTVIGRHHITLNEMVKGKQVLIKVGYGDDSVIITVPERFANFPNAATTPLAQPQGDEVLARDQTIRKSYYGEGEQPWDTLRGRGWGAAFAAGNVLKYLRRVKNPDDLAKARWYWVELNKMTDKDQYPSERAYGVLILSQLHQILRPEELEKLVSLSEFVEGAVDPTLIKET